MMTPNPPIPYQHWMLAEIFSQADTIEATLFSYVLDRKFREEKVAPVRDWLAGQQQLLISASGSSRHAGLAAEIAVESVTDLRVDVEHASEYSYRRFHTTAQSGVVVISQSGETADTLAALRRARSQGQRTLAITNVQGSTMDREADITMPTNVGPEYAIPATKSFTGQLLVLELLTILAAEARGTMTPTQVSGRLTSLSLLAPAVRGQLQSWADQTEDMAALVESAESFLFLGRDLHFPIAREGALKLKESACIHAEAYPTGELKHGPNALVSPKTPLEAVRDLRGRC